MNGLGDLALYIAVVPERKAFGDAGHDGGGQGGDKHRGHGKKRQRHAEQNAEGFQGLLLPKPRQHQALWNDDLVDGGEEIDDKASRRQGDGDGEDVPQQALNLFAGGLSFDVFLKKEGENPAAEQLADDHARHNQRRRDGGIPGGDGVQEKGYRDDPYRLLQKLGHRGGNHAVCSVKGGLENVLEAGEEQAGQKQKNPPFCADIPQKTAGDPVRAGIAEHKNTKVERQKHLHGQKHQPPHPAVAQKSMFFRGETADRRGKPRHGDPHDNVIVRKNKLVNPHSLRTRHPADDNAVDKPKDLKQGIGKSQYHCAVKDGFLADHSPILPSEA